MIVTLWLVVSKVLKETCCDRKMWIDRTNYIQLKLQKKDNNISELVFMDTFIYARSWL